MKKIIQYQSDVEREHLISSNSDLFLVEEQNLINGNFLVFDNEALSIPTVVYTNIPEGELESIKEENIKLKQEDLNNKEAIAELYMMSMGGF